MKAAHKPSNTPNQERKHWGWNLIRGSHDEVWKIYDSYSASVSLFNQRNHRGTEMGVESAAPKLSENQLHPRILVTLELLFGYMWCTWNTVYPPPNKSTCKVRRNLFGDYTRSQGLQSGLLKWRFAYTYKLPLQKWIQRSMLWQGWVLKLFAFNLSHG